MKAFFGLIVSVIWFASPVLAWDGYDYETGQYVEVEDGNLVRPGEEIEIYDYQTGSYHDVEVQDINRTGSVVELEVYDYETGEYRYLEMDD